MSDTAKIEPVDLHLVHVRPSYTTQQDEHNSPGNTMPSIFRLPPELLLETFLHVISPVHNWYTTVGHQSRSPVYYLYLYDLSLVCKHWLHIINNTPKLWTVLSIHFKPDLIRLVIQRSSKHPIDVDYTQKPNGMPTMPFEDNSDHKIICPLLMEIASRLRRAALRFDFHKFADLYLPLFQQPSPHLRELRLDCWILFSEHPPRNFVTLFQNRLPNLGVLELRAVSIPWTTPFLFHLRHLSLQHIKPETAPTVAELHAILSSCRSMETFTLNNVAISIGRGAPADAIPLKELRTLKLQNIPLDVTLFLLRILPLDELHHFDLEFILSHSPTPDTIAEVIGYCVRVLRPDGHTINDTNLGLAIKRNSSEFQFLRAGRHWNRLLLENVVEPFVDALKGFTIRRQISLTLSNVEWPASRYEGLLDELDPLALCLIHYNPQPNSYTPLFRLLARPIVDIPGVMRWKWENLRTLTCMTSKINWDEVVDMVRSRFQEPSTTLAREKGVTVQRPRAMFFKFEPDLSPAEDVLDTLREILGKWYVYPIPRRPFLSGNP